jgi:hypothetical protein
MYLLALEEERPACASSHALACARLEGEEEANEGGRWSGDGHVGTMAVGEAGEGRCRQPDVKHHPNPSPAWRLMRTRKEREVDGKGKRMKRYVHNEWQAGNYEEL